MLICVPKTAIVSSHHTAYRNVAFDGLAWFETCILYANTETRNKRIAATRWEGRVGEIFNATESVCVYSPNIILGCAIKTDNMLPLKPKRNNERALDKNVDTKKSSSESSYETGESHLSVAVTYFSSGAI